MAHRITIKTVRSGQPRAYADSVIEVHFMMEKNRWDDTGDFEPWEFPDVSLDKIPRMMSQHVPGLLTPRKADAGFLRSYITEFGPITGKPGWYRYVVVSPFTD